MSRALLALLAASVLAGCGLAAKEPPGASTLTVTSDFGARSIVATRPARPGADGSLIDQLMGSLAFRTSDGGRFVQSIDGVTSGVADEQLRDWSLYVNGVEARGDVARIEVHPGDAVWWDLHSSSAATQTPTVVGSFPEPFVHGIGGERLPVRIECSEPQGRACRTVDARMLALGVPAGLAALGPAGELPDTLRIAVAPSSALRALFAAEPLTLGPRESGVYARISADGSSIALLNDRGEVTGTLGAGAGLIAALRPANQDPLWVVTGTDSEGVQRAARALTEPSLHDRFAVALAPDEAVLALPHEG